MSSYTFAHEVGHNLSASHIVINIPKQRPVTYPVFLMLGYRVYDSHKTIMSYGYETRTPYFSNLTSLMPVNRWVDPSLPTRLM